MGRGEGEGRAAAGTREAAVSSAEQAGNEASGQVRSGRGRVQDNEELSFDNSKAGCEASICK